MQITRYDWKLLRENKIFVFLVLLSSLVSNVGFAYEPLSEGVLNFLSKLPSLDSGSEHFGLMVDIKTSDGATFRVSKVKLSDHSAFFPSCFTSNLIERQSNLVHLKVSKPVFVKILRLIFDVLPVLKDQGRLRGGIPLNGLRRS